MSKPSAPQPPNYAGAATAQGQSNIQGAIANADLSRVNQSSPLGSINWTRTGGPTPEQLAEYGRLDPNNDSPEAQALRAAVLQIPTYSSSTSLSPALQGIFDQYTRNQGAMSGVAGNLINQASGTLSTPFDPSKLPANTTQDAVTNALYARHQQYLDPQWSQAETANRDMLASQGFQVGNEGYDKAMGNFGRAKQQAYADARDSAIAQGVPAGLATRQQAVSEALAARNQPINELSALQGGSQVSMPQFSPMPTQAVGGAPYMDAATAQNQAAIQNFGINAGMYNSQMGGLMGLGGMGAMAAMMSDRRLKTNIRRIGKHPTLGVGIYSFDYVWGQPAIGLMADEVERVRPDAVSVNEKGYKMINYRALGNPPADIVA